MSTVISVENTCPPEKASGRCERSRRVSKTYRLGQIGTGTFTHDLKQGDLVEIHSGPFAGYQAIFDMRLPGSDRVRILLKLLQGRAAKMEVSANLLERKR